MDLQSHWGEVNTMDWGEPRTHWEAALEALPGKAHFEVADHTIHMQFSDYEPSLAIFLYKK